jgi:hypothetical protein
MLAGDRMPPRYFLKNAEIVSFIDELHERTTEHNSFGRKLDAVKLK